MFSNDKNIETIAQLVEALKDYIELEKDYLKLDVVDKAVRLLTAASLFVVSFLFPLCCMHRLPLYTGWLRLWVRPRHLPLWAAYICCCSSSLSFYVNLSSSVRW